MSDEPGSRRCSGTGVQVATLPDDPEVWLLRAILAGSEPLDGAEVACEGSPELFEPGGHEDPELRQYRRDAALSLCARCPAVDACREWLAGQSRSRWRGWTIGGEYIDAARPLVQKTPSNLSGTPRKFSI